MLQGSVVILLAFFVLGIPDVALCDKTTYQWIYGRLSGWLSSTWDSSEEDSSYVEGFFSGTYDDGQLNSRHYRHEDRDIDGEISGYLSSEGSSLSGDIYGKFRGHFEGQMGADDDSSDSGWFDSGSGSGWFDSGNGSGWLDDNGLWHVGRADDSDNEDSTEEKSGHHVKRGWIIGGFVFLGLVISAIILSVTIFCVTRMNRYKVRVRQDNNQSATEPMTTYPSTPYYGQSPGPPPAYSFVMKSESPKYVKQEENALDQYPSTLAVNLPPVRPGGVLPSIPPNQTTLAMNQTHLFAEHQVYTPLPPINHQPTAPSKY